MPAADLSGNPRRYVWFGVFYNARAYYPVLAILFLDLGLTLDQFVTLNLVWAASIFLFEVPSGALADTIGRRKLLILAAALMVVEMLCLLCAPRHGGALLFGLCMVNRLCSGLSEACASGADEALAYDSLPEVNRAEAWDQLLASSMRWRSAGFVVAMIVGGFLYDLSWLNHWLPEGWSIAHEIAQRLPVALVFCQAFICLITALRMVEPPRQDEGEVRATCGEAFRLTLKTARWVITHPRTRVVVVIGLVMDATIRNFATLTSSYYRIIQVPEWSFGLIGAGIGLLGWFVPTIAKSLNSRFGMMANLAIAAAATLVGLLAIAPAWPWFGLIPATLLMTVMGYLSFTVSRTLHQEADSSQRATVLSVKGLAFNLGYGLFSLAFARLLGHFPQQPPGAQLQGALWAQIPVFGGVIVVLLIVGWMQLKRKPFA